MAPKRRPYESIYHVNPTTSQYISHIYGDVDLYRADNSEYRGTLRINVAPFLGHQRIHIREWFPVKDGLRPGRGIAFDPNDLDDVLYALTLIREDLLQNKIARSPDELMHESQLLEDAQLTQSDATTKPDPNQKALERELARLRKQTAYLKAG